MLTFHIYIGQKVSKDKRVSQHVTDPLKAHLKFLKQLKKDLKKPGTKLRKRDKRK